MLSSSLAAAQITLEPANIIINVTENATFTCSAMAYPAPTIKWFRQLENSSLLLLTNSTKYSLAVLNSGTMNQTSELIVMNITLLDVGAYVCQASSGVTTDNSSALLSEYIILLLCSHIYFPQVSAMKAVSD